MRNKVVGENIRVTGVEKGIRKLRVILWTAVYPDVERPRIEGESRTEGTWARNLGTEWGRSKQDLHGTEATRVSTRRDVAKDSLVTEGVSRPPNTTKKLRRQFWAQRNQTFTVLLKQS